MEITGRHAPLYRHAPGKHDLVVLMVDSALTEEPLPALADLASQDIDFDMDELFVFGMQRMLDGLAPLFEGRTGDTAGAS